jgi:ribosome-binding factor A
MANRRTIERLQARIHERAAHCLEFELHDPRSGMVTITRVELSSDLASAKLFYTVLGGRAERSKTAALLEHAAGFVQRKVAGALKLRRAPRLVWVFDEAEAQAAHVEKVIQRAIERDRQIQAQGNAPDLEEKSWEDEYEEMAEELEPPDKPKPEGPHETDAV